MKKIVKKIGILSDTHGNYLALDAVLKYFEEAGCHEIISLGDIINMAPHSARCLDRLLALPNCTCVRGNHDDDYLCNRRKLPPFSHTPEEHKCVVFDQLGDTYLEAVGNMPIKHSFEHMGTIFTFVHYALSRNLGKCRYLYKAIIVHPTGEELDKLFDTVDGDVVFYGHRHEPDDKFGQFRKYVDVGSIGCHRHVSARAIVLRLYDDGSYDYYRFAVPYDRATLKGEMYRDSYVAGRQLFDFYFDRKKVES